MIVELLVDLDNREYYPLDTYGNENVSLTFQIDDIRDIASKNASYSKDFNLPATKNNNRYFDHFYDVDRYNSESLGLVTGFNPYNNQRCILKIDGLVVLEGFLRLSHSLDKQTEISYKVTIYNNVANLIDTLGDATMNDIDWSYLNHERSWGNVYASFLGINQANQEVDYTYQFIAFDNMQYGQGYVPYRKHFNYMLCIRLKAVIDKMFEYAGFNYESELFNTDEFKRLYFDTGLVTEVAPPRVIQANLLTSQSNELPFIKVLPYQQDSTGNQFARGQALPLPNQDPTSLIWVSESGDTLNEVDEYGTITLSSAAQVFIQVDLRLGSATPHTEQGVVSMYINGIVADTVDIDASAFASGSNQDFANVTFTGSGFFEIGDEIKVTFGCSFAPSFTQLSPLPNGFTGGWYYGFGITFGSRFKYYISPTTPEAQINGNLGSLKLADILKDVITMYNLNIEQKDGNTIFFQPYSDFISQEVIDWTDKVDINEQEVSVVEIPKRINFKFARDDSDHYHNVYESQNGQRYGDHQIIYQTDNTDVFDIELKVFAAPVCRVLSNVAIFCQHLGEINEDVMETYKNKPRLVYRIGNYQNPSTLFPLSPVWMLDVNDFSWNPNVGS